jgi:hypothetical protein
MAAPMTFMRAGGSLSEEVEVQRSRLAPNAPHV